MATGGLYSTGDSDSTLPSCRTLDLALLSLTFSNYTAEIVTVSATEGGRLATTVVVVAEPGETTGQSPAETAVRTKAARRGGCVL